MQVRRSLAPQSVQCKCAIFTSLSCDNSCLTQIWFHAILMLQVNATKGAPAEHCCQVLQFIVWQLPHVLSGTASFTMVHCSTCVRCILLTRPTPR